jgi:transglutaminase-like putative cysteine protease
VEPVDTFRQRARYEAERYGSDRWVFVRELLQNARDAGAGRVWLNVARVDGRDRISCRDDGGGMTFDHARRYLFTLYASSKRDQPGAAGRFGIGFWSVLRFTPDSISVRSRPRDGDGWEVVLDGNFESATWSQCVMLPGTEIVLERAATEGDLEAQVVEAVFRDARYLRRRVKPGGTLEVTVNGRAVTSELELPPPSLSFSRPGLRGAVTFSETPKVELFAHGLRVRRAAFLDELLLADEGRRRVSAELPDGLVPQVVLDSDRLEVLMARGEAREDRVLRRLVALARSELERLVRSELDRRAPRGVVGRFGERIVELVRKGPARSVAVAVFGGATLGVLLGLALRWAGWLPPVSARGFEPATADAPVALPFEPKPSRSRLYSDLSASYRGPTVDPLGRRASVALRYRPADRAPLFAALRLSGLAEDGSFEAEGFSDLEPYSGEPCLADCLEVELALTASAGVLRVPIVTGHLIDPETVAVDGEPIELWTTASGEPLLVLERPWQGTLRYASAPGRQPVTPGRAGWPRLPDEIANRADLLLGRSASDRVEAALQMVREMVRYDRSPTVAERHGEQREQGRSLFDRTLEIGAGDCDVQNALLAAVLDRAAVPVRLAVGFRGVGGRAAPGLHAWVEYLEGGRWQVADASVSSVGGSEARPPGDGLAVPASGASAEPLTEASVEDEAARPGRPVPAWVLGVAAGAVGLVVLLRFVSNKRRSGRTVDLGGGADLARLLRGALLRPEAYRDVGSLYSRPIVPMVGGEQLSLRRVVRVAREGRLYRSAGAGELAPKAARRGAAVVDAGRAEGRAVADLLGARDLDAWSGALDGARPAECTRRLERALARVGERWRVRIVDRAPEPLAVLEGSPFGFEPGSRLATLDASSRLGAVIRASDDRPAWSTLLLADGVVQLAIMPEPDRRRLLADLARRAVEEALH